MAARWKGIDALLLEVIVGPGNKGADLRRIIYSADYIDRMVFHSHEMDESLRRLVGSALVTADDHTFKPTPSGREVRSRAPQGSVYDRLEWMRSHLDVGRVWAMTVWRD